MTAAHAAAHREVVADELVLFENRDEAEIVGEDVDVIYRRNDKRGLEFTRQISFAVKRILEILVRRSSSSTARPQSKSSDTPGCAASARQPRVCSLQKLARAPEYKRVSRRHDIAVHVAAGRQCRKQRLVDFLTSGPRPDLTTP